MWYFAKNVYYVKHGAKIRYINPLVKTDYGAVRINKISEQADREISRYLNLKFPEFTGFNFNFKPYNH